MFSLSYIRATNLAYSLREIMDRFPGAVEYADTVAREEAFNAGWVEREDGSWIDENGYEREHPLDEILTMHADESLAERVLETVRKAVAEEHGSDALDEIDNG